MPYPPEYLPVRELTGKIGGAEARLTVQRAAPIEDVYSKKLERQQRRVAMLEQKLKSLQTASAESAGANVDEQAPRQLNRVVHLGTNHPSRYDGWVRQKLDEVQRLQDAADEVLFEPRRGAAYNSTMRQNFTRYRRYRRDPPELDEAYEDAAASSPAPHPPPDPRQQAYPSPQQPLSPRSPRAGSARSARRYDKTGQHMNGTGGMFARRMRPRTAAARIPTQQTSVSLTHPLCKHPEDEVVLPARPPARIATSPEQRVYAHLAGGAQLPSSSPHAAEQRRLREEREYWERRRALASFARQPAELRRAVAESAPSSAREDSAASPRKTEITRQDGVVLSPRARVRFDAAMQQAAASSAAAEEAAAREFDAEEPSKPTTPAIAAVRYRDLFAHASEFVESAQESPRRSARGTRALSTILGPDLCDEREDASSDYSPRSVVVRHAEERADAKLVQRAAARLGWTEPHAQAAASRSRRAAETTMSGWASRRDPAYMPPSSREFRPHISMSSPVNPETATRQRPVTAKA